MASKLTINNIYDAGNISGESSYQIYKVKRNQKRALLFQKFWKQVPFRLFSYFCKQQFQMKPHFARIAVIPAKKADPIAYKIHICTLLCIIPEMYDNSSQPFPSQLIFLSLFFSILLFMPSSFLTSSL